jgi:hypothetical protein
MPLTHDLDQPEKKIMYLNVSLYNRLLDDEEIQKLMIRLKKKKKNRSRLIKSIITLILLLLLLLLLSRISQKTMMITICGSCLSHCSHFNELMTESAYIWRIRLPCLTMMISSTAFYTDS